MYQINLSNPARKELKKLDKSFQEKVIYSLRILKEKPFFGEKMSGEFQGSYRMKIPPVRIIYTPDLKNKIIWVRAIRHRQNAYK